MNNNFEKNDIPVLDFPSNMNIAFCDSNKKIFLVENGNLKTIDTYGSVFDIYSLPGKRLLYASIYDGWDCGLIITDYDGNILQRYITKSEVFAVYPHKDGYLVGELTSKSVVWLDLDLNIIKRTPVIYNSENMHEVMRGVRLSNDGNVWVVQPGDLKIRKYTPDGVLLHEIETGPDTFEMLELPDSKIIYTQHKALTEVSYDGTELRNTTASDISPAGLQWALNFKLLENGHILLVNWLGHSCEGMGYPVIELDEDRKLCALYTISPDAVDISDLTILQ